MNQRDHIPGTIYLIHFDRPFHHAAHYLGWSEDVDAREVRHRKGNGSRLLRAVRDAGIGYEIVRMFQGTRYDERRIKRGSHVPEYCPICAQQPRHPYNLQEVTG